MSASIDRTRDLIHRVGRLEIEDEARLADETVLAVLSAARDAA
jgi:hypothetical protein